MPLTDDHGDPGSRAVSGRKARQDAGLIADSNDGDRDLFSQIIDEIAILREENDDLRVRVRRLEARSGRGIIHPSEFSDGMTPRSA